MHRSGQDRFVRALNNGDVLNITINKRAGGDCDQQTDRGVGVVAEPAPIAGSATAQAQEEQTDSGPLQEIVITATHIATKLQDTPIAITAVTAETLETRALTTTADLGNVVPNAVFRKSEGILRPSRIRLPARHRPRPIRSSTASPPSPTTSTTSTTPSSLAPSSTCSIWTTWKCCAARRARSSGATRSPAP